MIIKTLGKTYPLDLTVGMSLGELRKLKRFFDLADFDRLNPADPDHMAGLVYVAIKRAQPELGDENAMAAVDQIRDIEIELEPHEKADAEAAADPNHDAANGGV